MKKLFLTFAIIFGMMMFAQAQTFNRESVQLYADTTSLTGGDIFVRQVYGFLPTEKPNGDIEFSYVKLYYLNGELLPPISEVHQGVPTDTVVIGGNTYTLKQVYDLIISINQENWINGTWQVFLQKLL